MLSLSLSFLLLHAAPVTPRLQEGIPPGFQVDGKLDEWKQPPSLTLGAKNQVAGAKKVSSESDLSAKVWLALGPEGLAIAGEVRDDVVQLDNPKGINADHVEVWLALPPPALPPLSYTNQFEEVLVPDPSACDEGSRADPAACKAWWKEQTLRRQQLLRELVAQFGVTPSGVLRHGATSSASVGTAHYAPFPGGYRFEALIPIDAFPATVQAPLKDVRLLVDLVDSDEGGATQETFLSSSSRRRFGEASTFHAVTLAKPLRFGEWPELLEEAMKHGMFYSPGAQADQIQAWMNPARGYQYVPEEPSPKVVKVDLRQVKSVAKLGDVELVIVPMTSDFKGAPSSWLVSRRGRTVLHALELGGDRVRTTPTASGLRVLQVYEGTNHELGTGACGACPVVRFTAYTMDAKGRFSEPEGLESTEGMTSEGVAWTATPDLSVIEAFSVPYPTDSSSPPAPRKLVLRHTLNARTGQYTTRIFNGEDSAP
ncbi:hypothetical protein FJV41_35195 [Myxococcus llanfairpwllgwyngyllgogerychwyrndrobwllllantysiliogogogochensis]|uniref:Uncharacterized protein n=1 Tax=Myxococcus llanfairpwllgwyngyllgogerychwyrndrobwllllantysiliogogogochensis TaxID=2590453 RepID=A0A540WQS5_9BACT|nr:hypothetical protein [Myxococcus llanfairpwllgwyngyllgogerychwyrndrobwllllantysiliogogogochensis]TQF11257.1 hypothetical protein FJV41_35195 [Myxococcus llanfairpwllgwyngyllgogerychwyrndrobwllllantysiliogogogochensis]